MLHFYVLYSSFCSKKQLPLQQINIYSDINIRKESFFTQNTCYFMQVNANATNYLQKFDTCLYVKCTFNLECRYVLFTHLCMQK